MTWCRKSLLSGSRQMLVRAEWVIFKECKTFDLSFFSISLQANMDIKFYTKTRLYAKNDHTWYNVTGCRGKFFTASFDLCHFNFSFQFNLRWKDWSWEWRIYLKALKSSVSFSFKLLITIYLIVFFRGFYKPILERKLAAGVWSVEADHFQDNRRHSLGYYAEDFPSNSRRIFCRRSSQTRRLEKRELSRSRSSHLIQFCKFLLKIKLFI